MAEGRVQEKRTAARPEGDPGQSHHPLPAVTEPEEALHVTILLPETDLEKSLDDVSSHGVTPAPKPQHDIHQVRHQTGAHLQTIIQADTIRTTCRCVKHRTDLRGLTALLHHWVMREVEGGLGGHELLTRDLLDHSGLLHLTQNSIISGTEIRIPIQLTRQALETTLRSWKVTF